MYQTVPVPCLHCNKVISVPKGPVVAARNANRPYVFFCSTKCNLTYVAKQGVEGQVKAVLK
jgi:hypothetical protein